MVTKATLRRNNKKMVTVRVTVHLDASQLAVLFWHGNYGCNDWQTPTVLELRSAVARALLDYGVDSSYQVENDEEWDFHCGHDWALDQVMRVYGFTEDDLDEEDRIRRAGRGVRIRMCGTCDHPYGDHRADTGCPGCDCAVGRIAARSEA